MLPGSLLADRLGAKVDMHCIVMSGPNGRSDWDIHLSAEVIGYERAIRRVRILFLILAERKTAGEGWLRILHRGNVLCTMVPPWPLPVHLAEPE